jgi:hypothetical protein
VAGEEGDNNGQEHHEDVEVATVVITLTLML